MILNDKILIIIIFITNFLFIGFINTWGIYQKYMVNNLKYSILSISSINSLTIGLNTFCIFFKPFY